MGGKKKRQDSTGREGEPTFEVCHTQAHLYKRSERLLSYLPLVHCAPTSSVSSPTNLESTESLPSLYLFFIVFPHFFFRGLLNCNPGLARFLRLVDFLRVQCWQEIRVINNSSFQQMLFLVFRIRGKKKKPTVIFQ